MIENLSVSVNCVCECESESKRMRMSVSVTESVTVRDSRAIILIPLKAVKDGCKRKLLKMFFFTCLVDNHQNPSYLASIRKI